MWIRIEFGNITLHWKLNFTRYKLLAKVLVLEWEICELELTLEI